MVVHTNHPVAGPINTMMTMVTSDERRVSGDIEIDLVHVTGEDSMIGQVTVEIEDLEAGAPLGTDTVTEDGIGSGIGMIEIGIVDVTGCVTENVIESVIEIVIETVRGIVTETVTEIGE